MGQHRVTTPLGEAEGRERRQTMPFWGGSARVSARRSAGG